MTTFAEKVLAVHEALEAVPHAFGGALALAYYAEPRATVDIDVNVFVPPEDAAVVLEPLARLGADVEDGERLLRRDGQARVFWEDTPIDLFFAYDRFHAAAATSVRRVPFADDTIPILPVEHLVVCKAVVNRPKDWVDIQAVLDLETPVDPAEALRWLGRIVGDDDHRYERTARLLAGGR